MKREEKNLISRQKIMDSARREFAEKGYGLSSTNAICAAGEISRAFYTTIFRTKTPFTWPAYRRVSTG